jgi:hypothetical protein
MKKKKLIKIILIAVAALVLVYIGILLYMGWGAGHLGDNLGI